MAKYLSNRQKNLKIGIVSYTESNTVLEVTGKVGIGTANATQNLDVNGNVRIRGGLYDGLNNSAGLDSQVPVADGNGKWSWQPITSAGAGTLDGITLKDEGNVVGTAGSITTLDFKGSGVVVTSTVGGTIGTITVDVGLSTYSDSSGIANYATSSGVSTSVIGGIGSVTSLSVSGVTTTTILNVGTSGTVITTTSSGLVGVGTTNPQTKLQIGGVLGFTGNNVKIGDNTTGQSITTGSQNNFIGHYAGQFTTNGANNNFFGASAGRENTTGGYNNFIGAAAGLNNISGYSNNLFGTYAGYANTTGSYNICIGDGSGWNSKTDHNLSLGAYSAYNNSIGNDNIYIGHHSGISTSASKKVIIGSGDALSSSYFDSPDTTNDIQFAVGVRTDSNDSRYWLVGNENFNIGIGTTNPTSKLTVTGDVNISGVITATTFFGSLTGTATSTTNIPNLTGDVTSVNTTTTLATVNSNVGTFGSSTAIPSITVNAKGLVTGVTTNAITVGDGTLTLAVSGVGLTGSQTFSANQSGNATFTVTSNATSTNTPSTIVSRDISGNFSAGTITANLTGTATTATNLADGANITTGTINDARLPDLITSNININSGVSTFATVKATTFEGALTGTATTASSVTLDSVGLGTHTYGDYVRNISGTSNQITVTSGTGEGSTPTLSIPSQFTAPQDVTVTRDLQVNRNLNVTGNITIGGTSATLFTTEFKVYDPDIVLGFRTDGSGNDASTDNTANHGGIAIASTEGTPLISLYDVGVGETNPATYKKFMWFKSGTFTGLGTDAWLSNYAIGIGSTQVPNGVRLAAGSVQITQNDISVVRNINASGVVTATSFVKSGGTSSQFLKADGSVDSSTYLTSFSETDTLNSVTGRGNSTSNGISVGVLTATSGNFSGIVTSSGANISGVVTSGTHNVTTGNTYQINGTSVLSSTTLGSGVVNSSLTSVGTLAQLNVTGVSTFTNGPILVGSATSTGTVSQPLQVTGGAYVSGNLGIGVTNPSEKLTVSNNISLGSAVSGGTATPSYISLGNNFSNGSTRDKCKIYLYNSGTEQYGFGVGSAGDIQYHSNSHHDFYISNNASVRINSNKNLLIGTQTDTQTASQTLQVTGGAYVSGNVGVGTTRPLQNLHVQGNLLVAAGSSTGQHITQKAYELNSGTLSWEGSAGQLFSITNNLTSGSIFSVNDVSGIPSIDVDANGTVEIAPFGGNVGLGTTNPTSKLHVVGNANISGVTTSNGFNATTGNTYQINGTSVLSSTTLGSGVVNSSLTSVGTLTNLSVGNVYSTGIVTATDFNSTSDIKLKSNVQTIENPLDKIVQIRGVSFNWIENDKPSIGVIADEIQKILPELVSDSNPKTVNYNGLIGLLIEAVKELSEEVKQLKSKKRTKKS